MRSAISWMAVLAIVLAACGTPIADDEAPKVPPTTASGDAGRPVGADEAVAPTGNGVEAVEGDATPTGTDQRSSSLSSDDSIEQPVEPEDESDSDDPREASADERSTKELERVEDEPVNEPVTGEVPADMMAKIMDDLSSRTGALASDFTVVRAEAVVWNDGSLGCPQPGQAYTMALVDGYWIEIDHGGDIHDYRASAKGFFIYCEGGGIGTRPNA